MRKIIIASAAVIGFAAVPAMAQGTTGTTGTMTGGATASTPNGSVGGGAAAGTTTHDKQHKHRSTRDGRGSAAGSASTSGSGTIYTDRNRTTGGVQAGGSTTGTTTGTAGRSTSSAVDAYGSADRNGSTGDVFGSAIDNSTSPTAPTGTTTPN